MNIRIQRLELTNFKCFKHKEITFDGDVTTIRGRNGVGKTTIADAILWCLFGKNTQGQADFDLKTHDVNGKPIPNLDHSVEIELHINAIEDPKTVVEANIVHVITLKRTLKETWIKKRGTDEQVFKNNTTEYMINGEVMTAGDYKKYISELIDENVFKAITNPSYFPSLKWQDQRSFLEKIAGNIEPDTSDEFKELVEYLSGENKDIIAYRKHLSYQIKGIKDKLEKIPVRLEEQNKALPEKLDWDAIQNELHKSIDQCSEIDKNILAIKSGGGDEVEKEKIRADIKALQSKLDLMEGMARSQVREMQDDKDAKIAEASRKFTSLLNDQHDLEDSIKSFGTLMVRCKETADKTFKSEQAYIREHWKETQAIFEDSDNTICPVCHQPLPLDMMEDAKAKFNQHKAELKEQLTKRANDAKKLLADAETEAKGYEQKKAVAEQKLVETKEAINNIFAEKAQLKKIVIPGTNEILANDEEFIQSNNKLSELKASLESQTTSEDDTKAITELEAKKYQINADITNYQTQLASKVQYDKIIELIEGIEQEKKDLIKQLSELERKEDVARRYQDRQNQILEERINQHFSLVRWKMFRTVNNGGDPFDEPFCECYVDGVAYHDGLNQAARLNAGLDICEALCRNYNVSAPIIIDNAEAVNDIYKTTGQQIQMYVSNSGLLIQ